jgi:hypothetical protein
VLEGGVKASDGVEIEPVAPMPRWHELPSEMKSIGHKTLLLI